MELTEAVQNTVPESERARLYRLQNGELITWVQKRLLELGYTDGGPADGVLNLKTQGTILDFRNRNDLPLKPTITFADGFVDKLIDGPTIQLPVSQVVAETPQIAEKVVAVDATWKARFWAKVLGWPSALITLFSAILDNFGNAVAALQPVRNYIEGELVKVMSPLSITMIFTGAATVVSIILWRKAAIAEKALVEGYRQGTVKNDVA